MCPGSVSCTSRAAACLLGEENRVPGSVSLVTCETDAHDLALGGPCVCCADVAKPRRVRAWCAPLTLSVAALAEPSFESPCFWPVSIQPVRKEWRLHWALEHYKELKPVCWVFCPTPLQ